MSNWKNPAPDASPVRSPTNSVTMQIGETGGTDELVERLKVREHFVAQGPMYLMRLCEENSALLTAIAGKPGAQAELRAEALEQRVAALVGALTEIQEMARGWHSEGYSPVEAIDNIDAVAAKARATEA